ncbi:uncharacterized protein A4U43_C09F1470 [Asparagus officinalis]|uniref:Uncharacterized protein n=1 Tax=Asparagus officinalis TaxID=4686 RepID=A0A5P1E6B2_ASPOF|nr:chitin-inducible gibberellin-responsive protein 1-like [Asparagus officinalis]ONK57533.1 uncharacterized protein A4U43_C09F1470 [Asparagus officinalis]
MLRFDRIELKDLEGIQASTGSVIANCMLHHQPQMSCESLALLRIFLGNVRKLSPKLVVLVKDELLSNTTKSSPTPFVEFFCEAMHHFSSMFDAMACSFYGEYKIGLRSVEKEILGPRVIDYVSQFPFRSSSMEGFKLSPSSACNVSQAKYLLGLFNRGFSVQHDNGRLALCWKSRPLIGVSIWVPT